MTTLYSEERLARIMRLLKKYKEKMERPRLQRLSKAKTSRRQSTVRKST